MTIGDYRAAGLTAALVLIFSARALADPTDEARTLLNWCLAHPDNCSISIDYQKGATQWHIDYKGARLNVLASSVKVVHLLAYAQAVDQHVIDPGEKVPIDEWAQFWVGRDGGALAAAYAADSAGLPVAPQSVTNDQIVTGMIQQSDNAAPDYLLDKLGQDAFTAMIRQYIAGPGRVGYHDVPQSIAADFISWWGNPDSPLSGVAATSDYSGYASDEYRAGLDDLFKKLHAPGYLQAVRTYNDTFPPWFVEDRNHPPAPHPNPLSESQYEQLEKGYATRSNTSTYTQLMKALLNRNLGLSPGAQAIVEKFLEYRLNSTVSVPILGAPLNTFFTRYGAKDGSFATDAGATARSRTIYVESKDGTKVAFTVQLTGTPNSPTDLGPLNGALGSIDSGVNNFALAVALYPAFAAEVQTNLGAAQDPPAPSLVARIVGNASNPGHVRLTVDITNIGTGPTGLALNIDLLVSGTYVDAALFPPLAPGQTAEVTLDSGHSANPRVLELVIDPANLIPASQKQDNPQFEKFP